MRLDFALLSNCFVFAPIKGIRKVCSPRDHGESTALHILHKINFKSCS